MKRLLYRAATCKKNYNNATGTQLCKYVKQRRILMILGKYFRDKNDVYGLNHLFRRRPLLILWIYAKSNIHTRSLIFIWWGNDREHLTDVVPGDELSTEYYSEWDYNICFFTINSSRSPTLWLTTLKKYLSKLDFKFNSFYFKMIESSKIVLRFFFIKHNKLSTLFFITAEVLFLKKFGNKSFLRLLSCNEK